MRNLVIALGVFAAVAALSTAADAQKKPHGHKVYHYTRRHKGSLIPQHPVKGYN